MEDINIITGVLEDNIRINLEGDVFMDKDFENLINEAKKIAYKKTLSEYASCGHVGCALLTKKGILIQEYV